MRFRAKSAGYSTGLSPHIGDSVVRIDGRTNVHVTVLSQPRFLGLIGYRICLAMVLRWRASTRPMLKDLVLRTFHLYSLKEPPPIRSCQSISSTSEMEATMSRQELFPPIQQQVEHSTASQALGVHTTGPFRPADFNFPNKLCGKENRASPSKWFSEFPWLHYNEQNDFVFCFICVQQNAT